MADCKTLRGWFNRWFHGDKPAKKLAYEELLRVTGQSDYRPVRFTGNNIADCLQKAVAAKREAKSKKPLKGTVL